MQMAIVKINTAPWVTAIEAVASLPALLPPLSAIKLPVSPIAGSKGLLNPHEWRPNV